MDDEIPTLDQAEVAHSTSDEPHPRTDRLIHGIIHCCVYVFAIAMVSMVGAMVMGLFEHDIRQWGWVAGALTAAIGYPLGYVSFPGFKLNKTSKAEAESEARQDKCRQTFGPVKGSLVGIVMGVIVGIPVWFVIVVFWLSLALSPFTPDSWREGLVTSFFVAYPPPMSGLLILGWTWGVLCSFGIVLGLCGKMYKYGPAEKCGSSGKRA